MREIGPAKPQEDNDPGEVFYTIRREDVGKTVIETEIGPVVIAMILGRILRNDIGRRLYRINLGDSGYIWQTENNKQRREREERERNP